MKIPPVPPLIFLISSLLNLSMSISSNTIDPLTYLALGGNNLATAKANVDLPLPDSPTTASDSPLSMLKVTSLRALTIPKGGSVNYA